MKFSTKAMSAMLAVMSMSSQVNAFVSPSASFVRSNSNVATSSPYTRHIISSSSAKETSAKDETSTSDSNNEESVFSSLSPDFKAAAEQTMGAIKAVIETPSMIAPLEYFVKEYFTASNNSFNAGNTEVTAAETYKKMMQVIQLGMQHGMVDKYIFGVMHTALRGENPEEEDGNTVDFYKFGCDFFKPVMNLDDSLVLGSENLETIQQQLDAGENVVFFANHQSEADPQVVSNLFETINHSKMAEQMVYVAGHKVTTDALAIPFSMGRNLICIHSKKHIDADPDTKPIKMKQNLSAMGGMLSKFKQGGACIWVAPSGGRDRRNVEDGTVPIAKFDQKTVDMFRLMGNKSKVPTHYYSMSMVSYELCPPPDTVEAGVGEQRNVRFVPIGITVSEELENVGGVETRHLFTDHAFEVCQKGYDELLIKMEEKAAKEGQDEQ